MTETILKHKREINPENKGEARKFLTYLNNLVIRYLGTCDIFVLIESKSEDVVVFENKIDSDFVIDVIHRCLISNPPLFKVICTVKVITI